MVNNSIDENRRIQLSELNTRARAYASQLWQVPFAYLALVGVIITQLKCSQLLFGLLFISILGISVLIHMFFVVLYHNKTVYKIKELEKAMGLDECTSAKPGGTVAPFMALVFLGILSPLIYFLWSYVIWLVILIYIIPLLFSIVAYFICNKFAKCEK
jgi:hypothetical protein